MWELDVNLGGQAGVLVRENGAEWAFRYLGGDQEVWEPGTLGQVAQDSTCPRWLLQWWRGLFARDEMVSIILKCHQFHSSIPAWKKHEGMLNSDLGPFFLGAASLGRFSGHSSPLSLVASWLGLPVGADRDAGTQKLVVTPLRFFDSGSKSKINYTWVFRWSS